MDLDLSVLSDATQAVVLVGLAVFGIHVGVKLYKWLQMAAGWGHYSGDQHSNED